MKHYTFGRIKIQTLFRPFRSAPVRRPAGPSRRMLRSGVFHHTPLIIAYFASPQNKKPAAVPQRPAHPAALRIPGRLTRKTRSGPVTTRLHRSVHPASGALPASGIRKNKAAPRRKRSAKRPGVPRLSRRGFLGFLQPFVGCLQFFSGGCIFAGLAAILCRPGCIRAAGEPASPAAPPERRLPAALPVAGSGLTRAPRNPVQPRRPNTRLNRSGRFARSGGSACAGKRR